MKTLIQLITSTLLLAAYPTFSNAALIETGNLIYSTEEEVTSSSTGATYLSWGVTANMSYIDILALTTTGAYSDYHIASHDEAFGFYFDALATSIPSPELDYYATSLGKSGEGLFGSNYTSTADWVWFLSDSSIDERAGYLLTSGTSIYIKDSGSYSFSTAVQKVSRRFFKRVIPAIPVTLP